MVSYDIVYPKSYKYIASITFLIGIVLIMFKLSFGGWILLLAGIYTLFFPSNPSLEKDAYVATDEGVKNEQ